MTKDGVLIQDVPTPREAVDPGIASAISFTEWEAATAAGLDMYEWEHTAVYPRTFKERVIAWYQLHGMVKLHSEVKAQRVAQKKSRRKR